jgi:hypothetical protein
MCDSDKALDFSTLWFGTRRSMVQIHSPRPLFSIAFMPVAISPGNQPLESILDCAQYCAHLAFPLPSERHPPMGERIGWTC